jgi:hypothetical protein
MTHSQIPRKIVFALVILFCAASHAQTCKPNEIAVGSECVVAGMAACALTGGGECAQKFNLNSGGASSNANNSTPFNPVSLPMFEGDVRLACEAILCLSTSKRPSECTPSITRYFSIRLKKWSDTLQARADFLALCPSASSSEDMKKLTNALVNGAGRCDAESLNSSLTFNTGGDSGSTSISNTLPGYCEVMFAHGYTDLTSERPMYVGTPERGGFWVKADDYPAVLDSYNKRIKAEDAAAAESGTRY